MLSQRKIPMNAKPISATSLFAPNIRPPRFANWQAGADIHSGVRNGNHLGAVESLQGERQPTPGLDPKEHRQRYAAHCGNGSRGAIAGLIEAVRCAFGVSPDRAWMKYVVARREALTRKAEQIFDVKPDAGDA